MLDSLGVLFDIRRHEKAAAGNAWRSPQFNRNALVIAVKAGFTRMDCTRAGHPPPIRFLPLPAVFPGRARRICLHRTHESDSILFCGDAHVFSSFLLLTRPSSVRASRHGHVAVSRLCITLELQVYKGDETGSEPARVVSIPVFGADNHVFQRFTLLCESAPVDGFLFSTFSGGVPALTIAVRTTATSATIFSPSGCTFTGKPLRSGVPLAFSV